MTQASPPARSRGSRTALLLALAVAMLLAQALGLMHRTLHGLPGNGPIQQVQAQPSAHAAAHDLAALFAGHERGPDCQLFDSLLPGAPPSVAIEIVPPAWTERHVERAQGLALARWAALYDARGPPVRA